MTLELPFRRTLCIPGRLQPSRVVVHQFVTLHSGSQVSRGYSFLSIIRYKRGSMDSSASYTALDSLALIFTKAALTRSAVWLVNPTFSSASSGERSGKSFAGMQSTHHSDHSPTRAQQQCRHFQVGQRPYAKDQESWFCPSRSIATC